MTILLLIPDAHLRDIYISRFEREGWEAEAATTLVDAERRAVQLRPAILLVHHAILDNVKTALKRLRSLPTLLKTRIVVMDKTLSRAAVDTLLAAGVDEVVLTAHTTPQALVKRMTRLIDANV